MRWRILVPLCLALFLLVCIPVGAEESDTGWPGMDAKETIDYSRYVIDPASLTEGVSGFVQSLKAYSNTGYQIMFILGGVMLIPMLFNSMTAHTKTLQKGVETRALNREITALDFDENRTEVIRSKMREKEINLMAGQRFRAQNWDSLVEDGVHQKELSLDIKKRFRRENYGELVEDGVHEQELGLATKELFRMRYSTYLVNDAVHSKELQLDAEKEFREKNWDKLVDSGVQKNELSRAIYAADVDRNYDDVLLNGAVRLEMSERIKDFHRRLRSEQGFYRKSNDEYYQRKKIEKEGDKK